jgi:uncharacterized glyoxalase superfamily protein PhnB
MIGSGEAVRGREKKGAFPIFVPDCDAAYQRAMEAGATSMGEPADRHYGERSGFVKDFAGSHWFIATRFASTPVREGLGSRMPFVYPERARVYIDFLQTAFGAEEFFSLKVAAESYMPAYALATRCWRWARVLPHRCQAGFSYTWRIATPGTPRAVAAGATSIQPPADQPYHHRTAVVLDPLGHEWIPAL